MSSQLKELIDLHADVVPLTVEQYHQMIRTGILEEGLPIELLDGYLVRKDRAKAGEDSMTIGHEHAWVVRKLTHLSQSLLKFGCDIQVQLPITLPPDGEPEPDATIVRGTTEDYRDRHPEPGDILYVIEVADSSLQRDRTTKQRMYADAGIPRYLIVNLVDKTIEEYAEPRAGAGRYDVSQVLRKGQDLRLELDGERHIDLPVADLLP